MIIKKIKFSSFLSSHRSRRNFLIYEKNLIFFFISAHKEETYLGAEATASVVIHRSRTVLNKVVLQVLTDTSPLKYISKCQHQSSKKSQVLAQSSSNF